MSGKSTLGSKPGIWTVVFGIVRAVLSTRLSRLRTAAALVLVGSAFAALSLIGVSGVISAAAAYTYGYGYQYGPTTGHLIVIKHVVNNNGGTAPASAFTMTINGVTATGGNSFPGAEPPGTDKEVTTGSYSVTESGPAGYDASFSAGCSGSIGDGETKTCTITNDDHPAHLIVIKHVVNDDGGTAVAANFTMTINGVTATGGNTFPGAEPPGTDKTVSPGSYNVTETGLANYTASFSPGCTGSITIGQTKTCTVTNDDVPAHLIVIKHVINDDGGTAVASNFTMTINGVTAAGGNSFPGAEAPGTNKAVHAGTYNVTETGPTGYASSFSADCSSSITIGQTKTCTVTNNDIAPHLIVIKHVINDDGGKATASQFTMKINGVTVVGDASFPGQEAPGTNKTVRPGSYFVSETGPGKGGDDCRDDDHSGKDSKTSQSSGSHGDDDEEHHRKNCGKGYIATFSADCTGTIAIGETKTCTITNNDIAKPKEPSWWKSHSGETTASLPQNIGNVHVTTFTQAQSIFSAPCSTSQPVGCLAAQLLAAELNLQKGGPLCVQATVATANLFLSGGPVTVGALTVPGITYTGPGAYTLTPSQKIVVLALTARLTSYNDGGCD
jgi:hypothetical protein